MQQLESRPKMPIRPLTDQGAISILCPAFVRPLQKVAKVKETRKRRGKGQEKSLKRAMSKKVQILAYAHSPKIL